MNLPSGKRPVGKQPSAKLPAAKQAAPQPATSPFHAGWGWDDVIGYTFNRPVDAREVKDWVGGVKVPQEYPTVYYKEGRRTLSHGKKSNVRWHGPDARAFFGNVHDDWLNELKAKDPDRVSQADLAKLVAAAKKPAPPKGTYDIHVCTSYHDPNASPSKWVKDSHEFKLLKATLVEIFANLKLHYSRNRFTWVAFRDLKQALHELAKKGP